MEKTDEGWLMARAVVENEIHDIIKNSERPDTDRIEGLIDMVVEERIKVLELTRELDKACYALDNEMAKYF